MLVLLKLLFSVKIGKKKKKVCSSLEQHNTLKENRKEEFEGQKLLWIKAARFCSFMKNAEMTAWTLSEYFPLPQANVSEK